MYFSSTAQAFAFAICIPQALGAKFSYNPTSDVGPGNWDDIAYPSTNPNQCGGSQNSPIAVEDIGCNVYSDYILRAGSCTVEDMVFEINDHGVKATFAGDCEAPNMEMPGKDGVYDVAQFHIHTGSEHTVDGVTFGAEMHIVHVRRDCPDGEQRCFAVVGTKLNPASSSNNALFSIFLEGWIKEHNNQETKCNNLGNVITYDQVTDSNTLIDPYQFNRQSRFFTYPGGLTTPPCSEVVWWNLDDAPLAISVEQFTNLGRIILDYKNDDCEKATVAHHGSTSRPTQPIGSRKVTKICPAAYAPEDITREETQNTPQSENTSGAGKKAVAAVAVCAAANFVGQLL